jgi:hypothetical protein
VFHGEEGGSAPDATPPHQLTFTTFDGGPNEPAGWSGSFHLAAPTAVGGVVIQRIDTTIRQPGARPKTVTYWEAIAYIPPGASSSGKFVDDTWSPPSDGAHGSETTRATATFYDGLTMATLPSVFKEEGRGEGGKARVTDQDPAALLPTPSSSPVVRTGTLRY